MLSGDFRWGSKPLIGARGGAGSTFARQKGVFGGRAACQPVRETITVPIRALYRLVNSEGTLLTPVLIGSNSSSGRGNPPVRLGRLRSL